MIKAASSIFARLYQKMNLRIKLLVTYAFIGILPLSILFFISYSIISKNLEDKAFYALNQSFTQIKLSLERNIEYLSHISDIVSFNEIVQTVMSRNPEYYKDDIIVQQKDYLNLNAYFSYIKMNSRLYRIRLYLNGDFIYTAEKDIFFNLSDALEEGWLEQVNAEKLKLMWLAQSSSKYGRNNDDNRIISAVRKIKSSENYNIYLGYLRLDILESEIKNLLDVLSITPNTLALIVNSKNEMICMSSTAENHSVNLQNVVSGFKFNKAENAPSEIKLSKDRDNIIFSANIAYTDWRMFLATPRTDIIKESIKIRNYILWLMFCVTIFILLFSYFISRSITKKLFTLINHMKQIDNRNFNMEIHPPQSDEIGYLFRNFNYMMNKIALLMDEKYELGKEVKSAELKALQAQINPHFLYNTLDLLNWIAIENNVPQISSLVKSMSKYYKLSLNKGQDVVPLRDELEHIKEYVYIQNIRFDKQIQLLIKVDDGYLNLPILKFTLQPIVENSILHGISKKDTSHGVIEISCFTENKDIILTVKDDGIGIPPNKLAEILTNSSKDTSHGYGIKNIHTRYKIFYGEKYGLTYKSAFGFGTTVEIRFPLDTKRVVKSCSADLT